MGLKNQFFKVTSAIVGGVASLVSVLVFSDFVSAGFVEGELIIGVLSAGAVATAAGYNTVRLHKQQKKELFQKKTIRYFIFSSPASRTNHAYTSCLTNQHTH